MIRHSLSSLASMLLVASTLPLSTPETAAGQSTAVPEPAGADTLRQAPTCDRPEHRQFDFWTGEWSVMTPDGQKAGENTISATLDGCVLHERWTGAGGMRGYSYNIYDAARRVWHQTWVDDAGQLLVLEGGLAADGSMVMEGERPARDGGTAVHRITWTPASPEQVRQHWQVSADGGETWRTLFDGTYQRKR